MINRDIVNMLSKSKQTIGEVNPIIMDYDGEILSGLHRKEAGWLRVHKVDSRDLAKKWEVTPLMAKDMVRMHLNVQRKPSRNETESIVRRMAVSLKEMGIPEEKIASELVKKVPYTDRYVRELLPDKYKQMVHASKGEPELVPVVSEETRKPGVKVIEFERWEDRKARMHPSVSKMDNAVLLELQREGWDVEFQKEYCVRSTTPDLKINATPDGRNVNAVVYLDGEKAHEGREERDDELRTLLAKRHGVRVVSIPYKRYSESAVEEVTTRVREAFT